MKVDRYFIKKSLMDRLKAGEKVPGYEIALWDYADLKPLNARRVDEGDPDALVACGLLIKETS